jgi:uncharacterized BrkB/YihY/UPF0761 family membrane protein
MNLKAIFGLFRDSFKEWNEDKAPRLGAALAYYTVFSLGPFLLIVIAIASIVFKDARQQIVGTIGSVVGSGAEQCMKRDGDRDRKEEARQGDRERGARRGGRLRTSPWFR